MTATIVLQFALFFLGVIIMYYSGADGSWKSLNVTGWIGLVMCNVAILLQLILGLVNWVKTKLKN